ncbi:MAG TPA: hypothetical protein VFC26_03030 [Verrucomicrobiae bacterium]|nr:hypothetical protein [Verrucomicrobiae bacterium]
MKREDIPLERLFAAAREVETAPAVEMPPHLAGRVIAHWRAGACKEDSWQMLALIFRRALVCAGVVMLFSLAWGYDGLDATPENDEAYANYELRSDLMP